MISHSRVAETERSGPVYNEKPTVGSFGSRNEAGNGPNFSLKEFVVRTVMTGKRKRHVLTLSKDKAGYRHRHTARHKIFPAYRHSFAGPVFRHR